MFIANTNAETQQGVFVAAGGGIHTVVDTLGGWQAGFSSVAINDSGSVAFTGDHPGTGAGVYLFSPSTGIAPVLTNLTADIVFASQASINNPGDIALFAGLVDPVSSFLDIAVLLEHQGEQDVVIKTGDPLFGSTVTELQVDGRYLNDHDQVAFFYTLADGRHGVARADPISVSEPTSIMLLLAALTPLLGWFGRGSNLVLRCSQSWRVRGSSCEPSCRGTGIPHPASLSPRYILLQMDREEVSDPSSDSR